MDVPSEPLGADQRVNEIDKYDERYGRSEPIVENHGFTSKPVARDSVKHCSTQEGEADRNEENVKHQQNSKLNASSARTNT
jgi:hypothetical protein